MATALLQIKVMPESLDTDLESIKSKIKAKLGPEKAVVGNIQEQPIAFGLKQLIITTTWPEEKDTDLATELIKQIPGVSQADIIDYRRAIG